MSFAARRMAMGGIFYLTLNYTSNSQIANPLRTFATNAGWNQNSPCVITVNVNGTAQVTGTTTLSNPVFLAHSTWPTGSSLTINVASGAAIVGRGGGGGKGADNSSQTAGTLGQSAIGTNIPTTINNLGLIAGGGGGGGGGGYARATNTGFNGGFSCGGGGGGGRGAYNGVTSAAGALGNGALQSWSPAGMSGTAGQTGTYLAAGNGGAGGGTSNGQTGGAGGNGGDRGANGSNGTSGTGTYPTGGAAGGVAGLCTTAGSNANITWINTGTRIGTLG